MNRNHTRRLVAFAFLALLALGTTACNANVGVGVSVPLHGGWGGRPPYGGIYVGRPIWP